MESITRRTLPIAKQLFSMAIAAYGVLCLAVVIFAYRVFGTALAIGSLLMLCLPIAVSLRLLSRWHLQRARDFLLLLVLLVVDLGGVGYLVWRDYEVGMDERHAQELKAYDFIQAVSNDPAFRNVEAALGRKQVLFIDGRVASQADLVRLKSLRERYNVPAFVRVEVTHREPRPAQ
jgi:hypothetical protein